MNDRVLAYFRRHSVCFHLLVAVAVGLFLRLLAAHFIYGPQALDDYKHGVWPAYQYFIGENMDLPDYRSHLLVWILAFFVRIAHALGAESALTQVRSMYAGLALVSLLSFVGAYLYTSCFRSKTFAALTFYLLAIYPIMPFVSTRAFGEAVALSFVTLGLGMCEHARRKTLSALEMAVGFFLLGVAVLLRFQVGIISVVYFGYVLWRRDWKMALACAGAGLLLIAAQAGIDLESGKYPFETLKAYLDENAGGAAGYGVSPWYNTWLLVLGVTLFPFSLVFYKPTKYLLVRHLPMMFCLLAFVLIHSLVAHKEERFMYPIFGLLLIALAYVWALNRHDRKTKLIYQSVFLFVTIVGLPVATLVNSQAGEIEPAAQAERSLKNVAYIDHQSLFAASLIQFYFLRPPSQIFQVEASDLNLAKAEAILAQHPELSGAALLTSEPSAFAAIQALADQSSSKLHCGPSHEATSFVDRLLYRLNPRHNQRRRPTVYILCERQP
jgi:hypothetical protein